jgi:hypothetical protein
LLDLPRMDDPIARGTMNVLTVVLTAVIFTNVNLTCLIAARMANLSLETGNSDGSCLAYVCPHVSPHFHARPKVSEKVAFWCRSS